MSAIIDFHGHLYPLYDPERLFSALTDNARRRFPNVEATPVLCLAERVGQRWFSETFGKGIHILEGGWEAVPCEDELSILLKKEGQQVFLVAGRQFVTSERIEVLCLISDLIMEDGLPIETVIERILEARGVPVLPWSPGKWTGERGEIVRKMFEKYGPAKLFVGDTSMRPTRYSGGNVFRWASEAGFVRLPGSDPLPLTGEEKQAGGFSAHVEIACIQPGVEIREFLHAVTLLDFPASDAGYLSVFKRWIRLKFQK